MIKNIIFDWSGVIKDCILDHLDVVNKMFKVFGIKAVSLDELKQNWKQPYMHFYNKYLPDLTLQQEQTTYEKIIVESPKGKPYPGIVDLIFKIKKTGKKILVVSSDSALTILPEIKDFGLEETIDDMAIGAHDKEAATADLVKRNKLNKEETIIIGDSNHEVEIGRKLDVKTVAVTWGFCTEDTLKAANPDFVVHNLKELEDIIK